MQKMIIILVMMQGWWKIRLKIDIIKVLVLSIARRDNKALFYTSFEYADLT